MIKSVCVMGLGYIGLPTSAMFAEHGVQVTGVDPQARIVDALNAGEILIEEPGLQEMVHANVKAGRLSGSTKPVPSDAFVIAVPTPIHEDKTADMRYVQQATEDLLPHLKKGDLIVLESTSPPRTVEDVMLPILAKSGLDVRKDLHIAHSPETVFPGKVIRELTENDRIVGGLTPEATARAKELYEIFVEGRIHLTDATTAETCKLIENTFRDVNIAFANELAQICEYLGVNAWEVIELSNSHPRVNILQPGPGVGGHCIAVDPWFVVEKAPEIAKIVRLSRETNDSMPRYTYERALDMLRPLDSKKKVAIFGATFKPDTDDIRESPIAYLVDLLKDAGIEVSVYDPHAVLFEGKAASAEEAVKDADLLIMGVAHTDFKGMDVAPLAKLMRKAILFDTKNIVTKETAEKAGFTYHLLGMGGTK